MRKEKGMSLNGYLTVYSALVVGVVVTRGSAMSYCSNSFRFDQLCPDPRFGTRDGGASSHLPSDTNIFLNSFNYRGRGAGGANYPSNSYGASSAMSLKDQSTNACDFHRNGMETDQLTAVHVTENPWNFRHAKQCSQIFKLSYDVYDSGGVGGTGASGLVADTMSSSAGGSAAVGGKMGNAVAKERVCEKEIGIRRQGSNNDPVGHPAKLGKHQHHPLHQEDANQIDEEIARKMHVYFWHNFTIYPHSVEFVDTILNYRWSKEDIACVKDKQNAQYVQIAVVVSKSGRCEIIVQQYKINEKRSPFGCPNTGNPIPYPIQFCGSYDCSQNNAVLTGLKLLSRRDLEPGNKGQQHVHWNNKNSQLGSSSSKSSGRAQYEETGQHAIIINNKEDGQDMDSYGDYEEGDGNGEGAPCVTETSTAATTSGSIALEGEEGEGEAEPMDWIEAVFLCAFPIGGVVFIGVVLNILRSKSGREICRGYPYPLPNHHQHQSQHSMYHHQGSFASLEKNALPM